MVFKAKLELLAVLKEVESNVTTKGLTATIDTSTEIS